MRRYSRRARSATGPVLAMAALGILSGCSSTTEPEPTSTAPSTSSTSGPVTSTSVVPRAAGVSPDGVTTAVSAPAESTEDDYFQACRAARTWMDQQGGDPGAQFEPYLKMIQSAESYGPATFGRPWPELSPGQQSAIIVAVEGAVEGLCI
ncbi:MAG: lipoprotein LpqV [Actinomycetia bacterium]|nr:lipoprotein LpqV [Actinomycetes bacterium]